MPTYELCLMLRQVPRNELFTIVKRTAEGIFERGGFIRKIENLGSRALPYKISKHGQVHKQGHAMLMHFDVPPANLENLLEEYGRDVDVLRKIAVKLDDPKEFKCTLEDEMKPPAYREEVIRMMRIAKKNQKEKYPQNTGLTYYPFQK